MWGINTVKRWRHQKWRNEQVTTSWSFLLTWHFLWNIKMHMHFLFKMHHSCPKGKLFCKKGLFPCHKVGLYMVLKVDEIILSKWTHYIIVPWNFRSQWIWKSSWRTSRMIICDIQELSGKYQVADTALIGEIYCCQHWGQLHHQIVFVACKGTFIYILTASSIQKEIPHYFHDFIQTLSGLLQLKSNLKSHENAACVCLCLWIFVLAVCVL